MAFNPARLDRVRDKMLEADVEFLYLRLTSNIAWLTGFERVFDTEMAHALLVSSRHCIVHSDSRYSEALRRESQGSVISVDDSQVSHQKFLTDSFLRPGKLHTLRIGIEKEITLAEFRALERAAEASPYDIELVELDGFIEGLRQVKDEAEIEIMRRAQSITDAAFSQIITFMKPGMTERQVQLQLDRYLFDGGAEGLAFDTIVATGAHASSPHAIPGETVLQRGDAVVMDFGAKYGGYCSDMTRTVFLGEPSDKLKQAWEVLRHTNETCEAFVQAGVTGADAHNLAEQLLDEGGFGGRMGHSLGHSVGIDIHEAPNLSRKNEKPLVVGNVVTVEPGIYIPGEFGMRLEDYGVVTPDGYEVFTQSTHDMVIIDGAE